MPSNEMSINLEGDALGKALAAALLDRLTDGTKTDLLSMAIAHVMNAPSRDYDKTPLLQKMFQEAVNALATKTLQEAVANDPRVRNTVQGMYEQAVQKWLAEPKDDIIKRMADNLSAAFRAR